MPPSELPTELLLRELLSSRDDRVVETALAARKAVLKIAEGCSELIYETYCISDVFSFSGKLGQAFIHIATYPNHVNLGFNRGTELEDPDELLKGSGKLIRHVRLSGKSDLKTDPVKRLLAAAVEQGRTLADCQGGIQPARVVVKRSAK